MRKTFKTIILMLFCVVLLAGCGANSETGSTENTTGNTTGTTENKPEKYKIGTVVDGKYTIVDAPFDVDEILATKGEDGFAEYAIEKKYFDPIVYGIMVDNDYETVTIYDDNEKLVYFFLYKDGKLDSIPDVSKLTFDEEKAKELEIKKGLWFNDNGVITAFDENTKIDFEFVKEHGTLYTYEIIPGFESIYTVAILDGNTMIDDVYFSVDGKKLREFKIATDGKPTYIYEYYVPDDSYMEIFYDGEKITYKGFDANTKESIGIREELEWEQDGKVYNKLLHIKNSEFETTITYVSEHSINALSYDKEFSNGEYIRATYDGNGNDTFKNVTSISVNNRGVVGSWSGNIPWGNIPTPGIDATVRDK